MDTGRSKAIEGCCGGTVRRSVSHTAPLEFWQRLVDLSAGTAQLWINARGADMAFYVGDR